MSVDRKLLEILCCPVTKVPVEPLPKDRLERLNALVARGQVKYVDGSPVAEPLDEALITQNGRTVYRVDDGIPVMLGDQGIDTGTLEGF